MLTAKLLLDHGANPNFYGTANGFSVVGGAARSRSREIVILLLERGMDIMAPRLEDPEYPLGVALGNCGVSDIEFLLEIAVPWLQNAKPGRVPEIGDWLKRQNTDSQQRVANASEEDRRYFSIKADGFAKLLTRFEQMTATP